MAAATTASPSFSDEILQTVSSKTTAWLPVTSPWVSIAACSSQLYGEFNTGPVVAFDPFYGSSIAPNQIPCLPAEVSVWWDPPSDNTVYMLGPTFVCPAAYSAMQTILVKSVTEEILCCPSSYTLGVPLTNNPRTEFPSQCYSLPTSGDNITYMTQSELNGSWSPFTSGIKDDPFTIYAAHVNGYNIMDATVTSSSLPTLSTFSAVPASTIPSIFTPTSTPSAISISTSITPSGVSNGVVVGVGIGIAAAVPFLISLGFFFYRRWRRVASPGQLDMFQELDKQKTMAQFPGQLEMFQEMDKQKTMAQFPGQLEMLQEMDKQKTMAQFPGQLEMFQEMEKQKTMAKIPGSAIQVHELPTENLAKLYELE